MIIHTTTQESRPAYHEGLLLVKLRPSAAPMAASFAAGAVGGGALHTPGFSAMAVFERAGLVKKITPLARPSEPAAPTVGAPGMMAMLAASASRGGPESPLVGTSLVELEQDAHVDEMRMALAQDPHVEYVSRVPIRYLLARARGSRETDRSQPGAGIRAVPPPASTMWNLRAIRWQDARNRSGFVPAENIKVAVLDTGIDRHHPDLGPRVKGYMYSHPDLPVTASDRDIIGHGTHVSGTIAALINNNLGINGISEAQIWMWKIFPDREAFTGRAFEFIVDPVMYQRALSDCIEQGVAAVNLSIGGSGAPDPNEQQLFNLLLSRGTIVVAAMGNEFEEGNPVEYPAAIPGVIAVGATSLDDTRASFSNMGNHIALCAPGVGIWSTLPTYAGRLGHRAIPGPSGLPRRGPAIPRDTNYASWDGTSMATPHVTGSVALLRANKGNMNPSEARLALMRTADKVAGMDGSDFTSDYGAGRLNLERLLA